MYMWHVARGMWHVHACACACTRGVAGAEADVCVCPILVTGAQLSPLQLSAVLGDRALVRHILKQQCSIMWVWGPVTQFALDLNGIDASGIGGGDVMELIVRVQGAETVPSAH